MAEQAEGGFILEYEIGATRPGNGKMIVAMVVEFEGDMMGDLVCRRELSLHAKPIIHKKKHSNMYPFGGNLCVLCISATRQT